MVWMSRAMRDSYVLSYPILQDRSPEPEQWEAGPHGGQGGARTGALGEERGESTASPLTSRWRWACCSPPSLSPAAHPLPHLQLL